MEHELKELYITQGLTVNAIAKKYGKSRVSIARLLRKYGLIKVERYEDFIDIPHLIRLKELGLTHKEIASLLGITINQSKKCYAINTRRSDNKIDENLLSTTDPHYWYLIGFFLADGHVEEGKPYIKLMQKNPRILHKIKDYYKSKGTLYKSQIYTLTLLSPTLYNFLEDYNLIGNKTYSCDIPNVPTKYFWDFIRGYFDGDGWLSYNYKSGSISRIEVGFVTGSSKLSISLFNKLSNYNFRLSIEKDTIFRVTCNSRKEVIDFCEMIYSNKENTFFVKEKYIKFLKLKDVLLIDNKYKDEDIVHALLK